MANTFSNYTVGYSDIWPNAIDIDADKSDDTDFAVASRGFVVGIGGAVKFTTVGGQTLTLTCVDGQLVPYHVARVWDTGTEATGIFGGY